MEVISDGREQMMRSIGEALGRPTRSLVVPLAPFDAGAAELDSVELVAQFVSELERVGAGAVQLGSGTEVKEYLTGLLPASSDEPVALSDGESLRRLGLREWLAASGRTVVPTLNEFIAERLRSGVDRQEPTPDGAEVAALVESYRDLLLDAAIGITTADFALADTGTLVLVSGDEQHRLISLLPPTHVCLLDPARVLPSLTHLLEHLSARFGTADSAPKSMTCITGPSRTADIEQAITMGVHGPKSLHVILYSPAS